MVAFGPFWKVAGTYESSLEISLQDVKLLTTYRIDLVNSGRFYRFEKLKIQSSFSQTTKMPILAFLSLLHENKKIRESSQG